MLEYCNTTPRCNTLYIFRLTTTLVPGWGCHNAATHCNNTHYNNTHCSNTQYNTQYARHGSAVTCDMLQCVAHTITHKGCMRCMRCVM
mmetsp:Transcript_98909/g.159455  ORF Transcript_98909/g.159455 Transcript_98909/m.159455 type:complete len:88 (+) Transcript_98909:76-339(+)